jgi:formyltetrahydrofolate synthetase
LADYVVTETGFGTDMGFERFIDIKSRLTGVFPDVAVMVCTVRALKMHSERFRVATDRRLDPELAEENLAAVDEGAANLDKQIDNVRQFGVPVLVAVNRLHEDTSRELEAVRQHALRAAAADVWVVEFW